MTDGAYLFPIQDRTRPAFILIYWKGLVFKVYSDSRVYLTPYDEEFIEEYGAFLCKTDLQVYKDMIKAFGEAFNRNLDKIRDYDGESYLHLN